MISRIFGRVCAWTAFAATANKKQKLTKNLMVTARTSGPFLVYSPEVNGGPAFNYTLI
jgi:hypothetical protein